MWRRPSPVCKTAWTLCTPPRAAICSWSAFPSRTAPSGTGSCWPSGQSTRISTSASSAGTPDRQGKLLEQANLDFIVTDLDLSSSALDHCDLFRDKLVLAVSRITPWPPPPARPGAFLTFKRTSSSCVPKAISSSNLWIRSSRRSASVPPKPWPWNTCCAIACLRRAGRHRHHPVRRAPGKVPLRFRRLPGDQGVLRLLPGQKALLEKNRAPLPQRRYLQGIPSKLPLSLQRLTPPHDRLGHSFLCPFVFLPIYSKEPFRRDPTTAGGALWGVPLGCKWSGSGIQ